MRFQVPQFIEVEDKIIGPFTFKQFVYIVGGVGGGYLAWRLLPPYIGLLIGLVFAAFGGALAFYRVNDRPFIDVLESAIAYSLGGKLYIWKKEDKKIEEKKELPIEQSVHAFVPKLSESKLKDLSWSLDINKTIYSHEKGGLEQGSSIRKEKTF